MEVRHAPGWQLAAPHRMAGVVIRALAWLGPNEVENGLDAVLPRLTPEDLDELAAARAVMPSPPVPQSVLREAASSPRMRRHVRSGTANASVARSPPAKWREVKSSMDDHATTPARPEGSGFKDPTRLTNWTRGCLYAFLANTPLGLWMYRTDTAVFADEPVTASAWGWGVFYLIFLITAILVCFWTYRANCNVRALGATGLRFSPGEAVGWHFVPIAWFWMPFLVMREIWRASANPSEWRGQPGSAVLGWWWALWLGFNWPIILVPEPVLYLVGGLLVVPLVLVFIAIIDRVYRMQMEHYAKQG